MCNEHSSSTLFQHFQTVRVQINQSIVNHLFSVSLALLSSSLYLVFLARGRCPVEISDLAQAPVEEEA